MDSYEARIEGVRVSQSDSYDSWGRYIEVEATSFGEAVGRVAEELRPGETITSLVRG